MAGHGVGPQQLGQLMGHPLGQPARVDEDQRAAMRCDQLVQPLVDLGPLLVASRRPTARWAGRSTSRSSSRRWPDVDDRAVGRRRHRRGPRTDQKPGDFIERPLRGRQADPHRRPAAQELRAVPATASGASRACRGPGRGSRRRSRSRRVRSELASTLGSEQQIERLGRGDQNVRRMAEHRRPLGGRRVAGADGRRGSAGSAGPRWRPRPATRPAAPPDCAGCRC